MLAMISRHSTGRLTTKPELLAVSVHTSSRCLTARIYPHVRSKFPKCVLKTLSDSYQGVPSGTVLRATAEAPAASEVAERSNDESNLQQFLSWLVANGVKGIGQEGSKVALFQSDNGERGLVCEEPISQGEVVLEVPLRLAITDYPGDEESNQLLYPGAPWSVRLACKLLRHLAAGERCPWAPYIKVLPRHVPAPLETFSWEDITALRYPAAQEALHSADWLRADAFMAVSEEARGYLDEEAFRWALSVVHSRTFANAAPGGGVGVRMLVPLVDMLNHGGDEAVEGSPGLSGGRVVATDNVRWDLLPADRSSTGGWSLAVSATRDLQPGHEVLLSYGERPNDDFFLHYGFVPRANPHDEAVLWPDLESALEWHYERLGAAKMTAEEAEPLYLAALEHGRLEQQQNATVIRLNPEKSSRSGGLADTTSESHQVVEQQQQVQQQAEDLPPEVLRQLAQIKVVSGGQVSAAVMRAFSAVSGSNLAAAERAVALRCAELLWSMSAPVSRPVAGAQVPSSETGFHAATIISDGPHASDAERRGAPTSNPELSHQKALNTGAWIEGGGSGALLMELAMLVADGDPRVMTKTAMDVELELEGDEARYWAGKLREYYKALFPHFAELLPEGAAVKAVLEKPLSTSVAVSDAATTAAAVSVAAVSSVQVSIVPNGDANSVGNGGLRSRYGLPPLSAAQTAVGAGGVLSLGRLIRALLAGVNQAAPEVFRLTGPQRLSIAFRCYKQMVLWDVLLGSRVEPQDLADFVRGCDAAK